MRPWTRALGRRHTALRRDKAKATFGMPRTTPPAAVSIRPADVADADALHRLCQALGRDAQLHDVRAHLQEVASEAGRCLLVAVVEGAVGGWLEVGARTALGTRPWAEVSGLVVDAPLRGLGLGRALLLAARRWAKEKCRFASGRGSSEKLRRASTRAPG